MDEDIHHKQYFKKNASGIHQEERHRQGSREDHRERFEQERQQVPQAVLQVIQENNQVWDGYKWMKAYYLSPISVQDMQLTSFDGTVENSRALQNPFWPMTASGSAGMKRIFNMITGRGIFLRLFCGYRLAVMNQNCSAHLIYVLSLYENGFFLFKRID